MGSDCWIALRKWGCLSRSGSGYYSIHPAVPWFFRILFEERDVEARERAERAYVVAVGSLGNSYHDQYEAGNRSVVDILLAEEPNLLHTRSLARRMGWWHSVMATMQALGGLYDHKGRQAEWGIWWKRLFPDFVDPATQGPLTGHEENWTILTGYRVRLKGHARQWREAERLQELRVEWARQAARDDDQHSLRRLVASLHGLGTIQMEMGMLDCVKSFQESFDLAQQIGNSTVAATAALSLGNAYLRLHDLRDLSLAEKWYKKSLALTPETDPMLRAGSLGQLGGVSLERFFDGRASGIPMSPSGAISGRLNAFIIKRWR